MMNLPEEYLLIRINVPHGAQTFFGSNIPLQGWCVAPGSNNVLSLEALTPEDFTCYLRQVAGNENAEAIHGFYGISLPFGHSSDIGFSFDEISFSYVNSGFTSESGAFFQEVLHFEGFLRISETVVRNATYEFLFMCSHGQVISQSNVTRLHLGDLKAFDSGIQGGPEEKLPPVLYYPEILLSSWALQKGEKISSSRLEICDLDGPFENYLSESYPGVSDSFCERIFPDFNEAQNSGIIHAVEFLNDDVSPYRDLAFRQLVSFESGDEKEILQGVSRFNYSNPDGLITSIQANESHLYIEGLLLCDHLPDERFFLRLLYAQDPAPCDYKIEFHRGSCSEISLGACTDRKNPGFSIKVPFKDIPVYCNDFMLFLESDRNLVPITTREDVDAILVLIREGHRKVLGYVDSSGVIRKFLGRYKKRLLYRIPETLHAESEHHTSSDSEFSVKSSVSFYFHNLEAVEGAPVVAVKLLSIFNEISSFSPEETHVTSFGPGALKAEVEKYSTTFTYCPDGSMIRQTEEGYFDTLKAIRKQLRSTGTRLVVSNCLDSFVAVDAAIREGVSVIWIVHESVNPVICYRKYPYRLRMHFLHALKHASEILFVSKATHDLFAPFSGKTPTSVIPNAIDVDVCQRNLSDIDRNEVRRSLGVSSNTLVFLSVGTTTERKGQDRTLRELALLKQNRAELDFVFLVAGARDIPFLKKLKGMVSELNLTEQVRFIYETPEVLPFYSIADFFIINSREESFPLVTLEAFSAKIPVLSTEVFGLKEIIQHEVNALAFDGDCEGMLCQSIMRLIDDPSLARKLSEKAFQTVQEKYGLPQWKARYAQVIEKVFPCC